MTTTVRIFSSSAGWCVEVREAGKKPLILQPAFHEHSLAWIAAIKLSAAKGWDIEAIYGQDRYGRLDTEQGQQFDCLLPPDKKIH